MVKLLSTNNLIILTAIILALAIRWFLDMVHKRMSILVLSEYWLDPRELMERKPDLYRQKIEILKAKYFLF